MRSEGVYINTLQVTAEPGSATKKLVEIPIPSGYPLLGTWKLSIDTEFVDTPNIRIATQLQAGPPGCADDPPTAGITEIMDGFVFRPGGELQAAPFPLLAPYDLEGKRLYLFIKVTNRTTTEPITARANVYAYFVTEESA